MASAQTTGRALTRDGEGHQMARPPHAITLRSATACLSGRFDHPRLGLALRPTAADIENIRSDEFEAIDIGLFSTPSPIPPFGSRQHQNTNHPAISLG